MCRKKTGCVPFLSEIFSVTDKTNHGLITILFYFNDASEEHTFSFIIDTTLRKNKKKISLIWTYSLSLLHRLLILIHFHKKQFPWLRWPSKLLVQMNKQIFQNLTNQLMVWQRKYTFSSDVVYRTHGH